MRVAAGAPYCPQARLRTHHCRPARPGRQRPLPRRHPRRPLPLMNHHNDEPGSEESSEIGRDTAASEPAVTTGATHKGAATPDDSDANVDSGTPVDIDHQIERILSRISSGWGRSLDVDAGWYALIIDTDNELARIDPDYVVHQAKQKFGTLRYYCAPSGGDPTGALQDAMDAVIDEAERKSANTCERCGQPGTLQDRGWVKTLCTSCTK